MFPVTEWVFYGFALLAILSAFSVIFAKNPVRSVLFLILCFFATGGLWILLESEFLAITLVLVYVGAVMVLFLFVVMMLDIEVVQRKESFIRYLPLGILVALLLMIGFTLALGPKEISLIDFPKLEPRSLQYSEVKELGKLLYTEYLYPFELAGILLLVAIVAAISLTLRGNRGSIAPKPDNQIAVTKKDRLQIVKMESERRL